MSDVFLTFKTFTDAETAEDFSEVLKQKDIPYYIEEDSLVFDPSYANNPLNKDYRLKIRQQDFEAAHEVLGQYYSNQLNDVSKDYYLFDFTDEELEDIIAKPDEWGHFDYQLAQKLLSERGKEVKPQKAHELREKRISELSEPETVKHSSVVWGYVLCFFFFPISLIMGWTWGYSKKTLPNGERVYRHDAYARKHGRRIFNLGITVLVLTVLLKVLAVFFKVDY